MPTAPEGSELAEYGLPVGEGVSDYDAGQQGGLLFLIRPSLKLRSWETNPWGLRLRLGFQFSIVRFERIEDFDLDNVRIAAFIPGIEGVIPIGRLSLLRPYVDLGVGKDLEGSAPATLLGLGLWSEFVFPWKQFELGLEPRIEWLAAFTESELDDDSYAVVGFQADARHPLWFRMGESQPDAGVYVRYSYLWRELDFADPAGGTLTIEQIFEVGAIFGFQVRPKIWFVRIPTIGFGYRFGDLKGFTIRIGGDRITRLAIPLR